MPVCYSFAIAKKKEAETCEKVRTAGAKLMDDLKTKKLGTCHHLCATLHDGRYDFLLKFNYRTLADVARAVLNNSRHFREDIERTITMLEYPGEQDSHRFMKNAPFDANSIHLRTILLVREKLEAGKRFENSEHLKSIVKRALPEIDHSFTECIDVFGTFDYIVEFAVCDSSDSKGKTDRVLEAIETHEVSHEVLFCRPFRPKVIAESATEADQVPDSANGGRSSKQI
ncbi:hypothetical protein [Paraburkholderia sp. CI3]|uniref:hypothetical protein n=1 Tax=Paraburkholderia sp. CI3 TaxID=2991060 RepID=UPI003D2532E9